ncbi:MAG TPA: VOC family protein [Acidimicrobiales bacterium]|nr:VOC family protein [Acidimicrobiales bacterium]
MDDHLSGSGFLAAPGVADWRALWGGGWAVAHFSTRTFTSAVALARAIGELMSASAHPGDIDLRHDGVTVRLFSGAWEGLSRRDAALAQAISIIAREHGAVADPAAAQHVQLSIAAADIELVRPFWSAVLGYAEVGEGDVLDPLRRGPTLSFHRMDPPRTERNRIHVDVYVAPDLVESRIQAGIRAGGRVVYDNAPHWWTLADPEGNEVDLAIWMDD